MVASSRKRSRDPSLTTVAFRVHTSKRQQRPDRLGTSAQGPDGPQAHGRQALEAAPSDEVQQYCLRLVIRGVAEENRAGAQPPGLLRQEIVPQAPGRLLDRLAPGPRLSPGIAAAAHETEAEPGS